MAKQTCLCCNRVLDTVKDETIFVANEGHYHYLCMSCGERAEFIDVWKVGNDQLGWSYTDRFKLAYQLLHACSLRQRIELKKEVQLNLVYAKLPQLQPVDQQTQVSVVAYHTA